MATGLEFAAGILAIVGVADIAIRAGRDIHTILCDIVNAPQEMRRVRDSVKEVVQLVEASKKCLNRLESRSKSAKAAVQSISSALTRLNIELEHVKAATSKFTDLSSRRSRIKYVFEKRKLGKLLERIERCKTLLAPALVVVCRELSEVDHQTTKGLIKRCFMEQVQETDSLVRSMSGKMEEYHEQNSKKQEIYHAAAISQQEMADKTTRELCFASTSTLLRTQTGQLSDMLRDTQDMIIINHEETRDSLRNAFDNVVSEKMDIMKKSIMDNSPSRRRSNRQIYFFGERRDMIMAYLLLARTQLEIVNRHVLVHSSEKASYSQVQSLQSEFERLVGSASQEEASRYAHSTACSTDRWIYSTKLNFQPANVAGDSYDGDDQWDCAPRDPALWSKSRASKTKYKHIGNTSLKTLTHVFPFGRIRIFLPNSADQVCEDSVVDGTGFSLICGIGESVHTITVRFFERASENYSPSLCAQLNVFTLAKSEEAYIQLFAAGSVEEIDTALRQGIISPYHINKEGRNLCLYYAAEYTRRDLFNYLDDQGIGVSNLKHDSSLVAGLFKRSRLDRNRPELEASVEHVLAKVYDESFFLTEMTMGMLLWDYYKGRPRALLRNHLQRLQREQLAGQAQTNLALETAPWDWKSVSSIMYPLVATGAYTLTTGSLGRNPLQRTFGVLVEEMPRVGGDPGAVEEILHAFIKAGVDVQHQDNEGWTPSMYAKRCGFWPEWCQALLRSGHDIQIVLREENSEWLESGDWQAQWQKRYG